MNKKLPWIVAGAIVVVVALIVVGVVTLGSLVGTAIADRDAGAASNGGSSTSDGSDLADLAPAPAGLITGDAPDVIVVYFDLMCPFCGQFDETNSDQIASWVEDGTVTVDLRPLTFLDRASVGSRFSTRAAGALLCQADLNPAETLSYSTLLFANQPEEGTAGLTNAELIDLASEAGGATSISDCVEQGLWEDWALAYTQVAFTGPIEGAQIEKVKGTPTVLVNGVQYPGSLTDAAEFKNFVASQLTP